jgi:hypothetical protein
VQSVAIKPWGASASYAYNIDTSPPIVPFWIRLIQGDLGPSPRCSNGSTGPSWPSTTPRSSSSRP